MVRPSKNVRSSLSNLPSLILNRHQISRAAIASARDNRDNRRFLLRRLCGSGLDEEKIFSNISSSSTTIRYSHKPPPQCLFDSSNIHYTFLSPDNFSPVETPLFPGFNGYGFRGSCGGVMCFDNDTEEVIFWNPTTNEVKFLPHTDQERPDPEEMHPTRIQTSVLTAGFGFDPKSQDYKYIRWVNFFFDKWDECGFWRYEGFCRFPEIYSLKSDSWKLINCPYKDVIVPRQYTALVSGCLYWCSCFDLSNDMISFDLSTEEFSRFLFPPTQKGTLETYRCKLFDFGGRLGVVLYPSEEEIVNDSSFELWVWNGGWWSREFDDYIEGGHEPSGFSRDGRLMFLVGVDHLLYVYDIHTKKLKKLDLYCNQHQFDIIPYVESTFSLGGKDDDH